MRGQSFEEFLEEALRAADEADGREQMWTRRLDAPVTSPLLIFATPVPPRRAPWAFTGEPRRRQPHRLTVEQHAALESLTLLGADLPPGFTAEELRREYRRLARRYHPDGQQDGSALDRTQAARCFAQVVDAYRRLRLVVELAH